MNAHKNYKYLSFFQMIKTKYNSLFYFYFGRDLRILSLFAKLSLVIINDIEISDEAAMP